MLWSLAPLQLPTVSHGDRVFIEEYLQDLRRDRFSPPGLVLYARRAGGRVREYLVAHPGAVRSVWSLALLYFAAAFVAAAVMALAWDRHLAHDLFVWTALGILPTFTLVTLHLDLLRDREGYRLPGINLPIALTLLRATLLPAIVLFLAHRLFPLALVLFLLAALSDVLDGWLARRWNQVTQLGTVLDPIVDIVFNLSIFLSLTRDGMLPGWVGLAATLRYGILLVGGVYLYLFVGPVRIRPTAFGRLTGVVMATLMFFLVALGAFDGRAAERLMPLTRAALGVLLCATIVHVVALGWYNLRVMAGAGRSGRPADAGRPDGTIGVADPAGVAAARGRVVGDVRWGAR